jgi:hypothetical protein
MSECLNKKRKYVRGRGVARATALCVEEKFFPALKVHRQYSLVLWIEELLEETKALGYEGLEV